MTALNFLNCIAFFIYLFLGIYALFIRPRYTSNFFFAAFCLSFAVWAFGMAFVQDPHTAKETAILFNNINSVGWTTFCVFFFWFAVSFASRMPRFRLLMGVLSVILPLLFVSLQLNNKLAIIAEPRQAYGWAFIWSGTIWDYLYFIYYSVFMLYGILVFALELKYSRALIQKKQIIAILFTTFLALALGSLFNVLLPLLHILEVPQMAHLSTLIWVGGIALAIGKYKLRLLTPALASRDIVQTMDEGLLLVDAGNIIIDANRSAFDILGMRPKHLMHTDAATFLHSILMNTGGTQAAAEILPADGKAEKIPKEIQYMRSEGDIRYLSVKTQDVIDRFAQAVGKILIFKDITEEKKARSQLEYMATHDFLTGLPNRHLLYEYFGSVSSHADRFQHKIALLMLDLNGFKAVNDNLGHSLGDSLLISVAHRLKANVREYDTIARMGGDEFIVLLNEIHEKPQIETIAARIDRHLREPVNIRDHHLNISASIGVSIYPDDAGDLELLIQKADMAMYDAKSRPDQVFVYADAARISPETAQ